MVYVLRFLLMFGIYALFAMALYWYGAAWYHHTKFMALFHGLVAFIVFAWEATE